ncbi:MAG: cytochrome C oxidase subunit IV family protein [Balneolaceae bacterium]
MQGHHISSAGFLWTVGTTLLILTLLTVSVTWIHIPAPFNIIVAISIAVVKATTVALFFMNLWWDTKFNLLLLFTSIVFLGLLIGLTLIDTMFRSDVVPGW